MNHSERCGLSGTIYILDWKTGEMTGFLVVGEEVCGEQFEVRTADVHNPDKNGKITSGYLQIARSLV